jgi:hypothetical protein
MVAAMAGCRIYAALNPAYIHQQTDIRHSVAAVRLGITGCNDVQHAKEELE